MALHISGSSRHRNVRVSVFEIKKEKSRKNEGYVGWFVWEVSEFIWNINSTILEILSGLDGVCWISMVISCTQCFKSENSKYPAFNFKITFFRKENYIQVKLLDDNLSPTW